MAHFRAYEAPLLWCDDPIVPESHTEVLLGAYHVLTTYLVPGCALVHTGKQGDEAYVQRITAFKDELNLVRVWMEHDPEPDVRAALVQSSVLVVALHQGAERPSATVPFVSTESRVPSTIAELWASELQRSQPGGAQDGPV